MPGVYRIEISSNKRAGCQNAECKKAGVKIQSGELRFGTFVTIQEHQSWRWKHWGCVTPQQIHNLQQSTEGDLARYLDGYEELGEHGQAKIAQAVEDGHVADEDWNGDVEVNREGQKGFRTPVSKKKARDEAKAAKEAAEDGSESPSIPAEKKKRSRAKKEADDEDVDEPDLKKAKAAPKKGQKAKTEQVDSEGKPQPKKSRKKAVKTEAEDDNSSLFKAEKSAEESIPPLAKRKRVSRKIDPKKIKSEDVDTDEELSLPSLDESDADVKGEDQDFDDESEASEEKPAVKKGRKPAAKRGSQGKANASRSKAKPKGKSLSKTVA